MTPLSGPVRMVQEVDDQRFKGKNMGLFQNAVDGEPQILWMLTDP